MKDTTVTLFQFSKDTPSDSWKVQDDTVMGGRSEGHFEVTEDGNGRFHGHVSLANGGGFSSIRHQFEEIDEFREQSTFVMRIKGDGKSYRLRIKSNADQRFYHTGEFPTNGEWEMVAIPFQSMYPSHHGERLDLPHFDGGKVQEAAILIGNKREEDFELLVDAILVR